jgi:hypothetical protein
VQNVGSPASGGVIVGIFGVGHALSLPVDGGGLRPVNVRYGATSTSTIGVYVNGTRQATLTFSSTGSWSTFATSAAANVTFANGANTLMFRLDSGDFGAVDLDTITIGAATSPPPPATGTATLTWDAHQDPTVTGYRVYYRLGATNFPSVPVITNNYSLSALASGTWCFTVTAVSPGNESNPSNEACKVIP